MKKNAFNIFTKFLVLLFVLFSFFMLVKDDAMKPKIYTVYSNDNNSTVILNPNHTYKQSFRIFNKQINGIQIYSNEAKKLEDTVIEYSICSSNGETLEQNSMQINKVSKKNPITLNFPNKIGSVQNKKLSLYITIKGQEYLEIKTINNNISMNVVTSEFTNFSKICIGVGILLILLFIMGYVITTVFKLDYFKYAIMSAFILGMCMNLFIPIGNVPDEANAHMINAYHISNKILGIEDNENNVKMRKCDASTFSYIYAKDQVMDAYFTKMFDNHNLDTRLFDSGHKIVPVKHFSYVYYLSALGISIGRLLNLNGILCFLMGRLFNFILFLGCFAYCLKKTPVFKNIFIFMGLLPITLQQTFSVSYDCIVFSLAILIVSLTIQMFNDNGLTIRKKFLLFISCLLLIPCKSFAYAPLILVPFSYLLTKINFKKFDRKKICYILLVIGFFLLILYGFAFKFIGPKISEGSIIYLILHPHYLYVVLRNTLYSRSNFIILSALGSAMELCHVTIFAPIILGYIVLMALIISKTSPKRIGINEYVRYVFILVEFIVFIGILFAMYSWSYNSGIFGGLVVEGFQGRYLLPILPLFFFSFNNQNVEKDTFSEVKTINTCNYLLLLTIFSLMIELLTH